MHGIHCLLLTPNLGTWPTAQACTLPGNQTSDLSVCRLALNPVSHTSQSESNFLSAHETFTKIYYVLGYKAISINFKRLKTYRPWLGSSVGWSIVPIRQGCGLHPWSGHVREATNPGETSPASFWTKSKEIVCFSVLATNY